MQRLEPNPPKMWQLALVTTLLFLLFSSVVIELQVSLLIFYGLALAGVVAFFQSASSEPFTDSEQTGFLILLVFFLISLLTYWINGLPGRGDVFVESRHAKFLLVIPVYLFFRHFSISKKTLWLLALAVSLFLFFVAVIDLSTVDGFGWPGRASGAANPTDFAVLALTMLSMLIAFRDTWSEKRWPRNTARLGVAAALLTLYLTKSYGIWLALPLVMALYITSRIERLRIRHILEMIAGLLCMIFIVYQIPTIKNAWDTAITDYSAFMQSDLSTDPARSTEMGVMLENWRASVAMIKDNPLLGVGPGGYQASASRYLEAGDWAPTIVDFRGPGNLYLSAFATRGVGGLVTTVLLMFAPILYCLRIRRRVEDKELDQYAFAVMLIVAVFFVAGFSVDVLEAKPLLLIYCTAIALLIGQIRQRIEN